MGGPEVMPASSLGMESGAAFHHRHHRKASKTPTISPSASKSTLYIEKNFHTLAKFDVENGELQFSAPVQVQPPPSSKILNRIQKSLSNTRLASYFQKDESPECLQKAYTSPPTSMSGGSSTTANRARHSSKDHSSFELLGVEIGHLSPQQQYTICASGVMIFLLIYGYLQEKIVIEVFDRKYGIFVSFLQFGGYAACCYVQRRLQAAQPRRVPLRY
eukprot:CAMPEP_0194731632 /NCGR_PEP_ID=MMETSP0296-20130528/58051_1 /TAXON_ID=39354 /ORGANISM="Heterosigma akashiwo, Strain CCMP2393" /LENGTH=216 /DNA_ID=CAMNT_0039639235 /DNA_START=86 /DNA_END=733 /DNA_ORIENTATION=-